MAPNQSNMANPPKRFWQNFTHSGVVGGGVKALAGIENPKKDYENAIKHSESPPFGVVMSFNAKKTTHFDKFCIFGFFDDPIKKMVKIKVVVNKNRH